MDVTGNTTPEKPMSDEDKLALFCWFLDNIVFNYELRIDIIPKYGAGSQTQESAAYHIISRRALNLLRELFPEKALEYASFDPTHDDEHPRAIRLHVSAERNKP